MVDVSNLGDIIRFPFELLGKILNFFLLHFIEIGIIVGGCLIVYYLFNSGVVKRISLAILDEIEERNKKKEIKNELV